MLIKVKNHNVASLNHLKELVLRSVYETISCDDRNFMELSIVKWNDKAMKSDHEHYMLQRLAWMLKRDSEGKLDERKATFKKHNIDWRKFHDRGNPGTQ